MTKLQRDLLDYIKQYHRETCGVSPSFEEMRIALGMKSKSQVARLITSLEEQGLIRRQRDRARRIEIPPEPGRTYAQVRAAYPDVITVPIYTFAGIVARAKARQQRPQDLTNRNSLVHGEPR